MGEWQPIETAPQDETEIVGHDESTETSHVTFWESYRKGWYDPDRHYYSEAPEFKPTIWAPIPPLPKRKL